MIYGNPNLVSSLASVPSSAYPNLREFGLVSILTPTSTPSRVIEAFTIRDAQTIITIEPHEAITIATDEVVLITAIVSSYVEEENLIFDWSAAIGRISEEIKGPAISYVAPTDPGSDLLVVDIMRGDKLVERAAIIISITATPVPPTPTNTPTLVAIATPVAPSPTRILLTATPRLLTPTATPRPPTPTAVPPTPTATLVPPTPTATSYPLPAPTLIAPFEECLDSSSITLQWTWVPGLGNGQWFLVSIHSLDCSGKPRSEWPQDKTARVRDTRYTLTIPLADRGCNYQWQVVVIQEKEDGSLLEISGPSEEWSFWWVISCGPTPTRPLPTATPSAWADDMNPAWSPDGKWIVFASNREGNWEVYKMAADGSSQQNLTQNPADDTSPAWSPDGGWVVFASNRDGNWEVYTMTADGSSQQNLTQNPANDTSPAWSPDGWVVFASDRDGNWEIYTMTAGGSSQQNLTQNPANDTSPAWSPDGWVVFASDRDGNWEIYTMTAGGSSQQNLTQNPADDMNPAWSPDGDYVVFQTNRDGNWEIYTMRLNGLNPRRLTKD